MMMDYIHPMWCTFIDSLAFKMGWFEHHSFEELCDYCECDFSQSIDIMSALGLTECEICDSIDFFRMFGATCDCEVLTEVTPSDPNDRCSYEVRLKELKHSFKE